MIRKLLALMALLPALVTAQTGNPRPMRIGAAVSPDTVQVGDPFILTVTVEVPAGARVLWPEVADSGTQAISPRTSVRVSSSENGGMRRETAEYGLAVWSMGAIPVTLPDIRVNVNNEETVLPLDAPTLFVKTVLPADTSLHVPKPAKGLLPRIIPWWMVWWPAFVVVALLLLLWWLLRSRKKKRLALLLDPFTRAERDFQRLERLALNEAGEQGRYVALAIEVLRTYLSTRVPSATMALTSDELLRAVADDSRVPTQQLAPLLAEGDVIKFGRVPVTATHARELAHEARNIVSAVEQAEQARIAAAKEQERAEKKSEKKRQADERAEAEEKARRESRRGKSEAA
ncbi:MAG: hypothetical protein ACO1Q7_09840 [Gemmatimonas sp.]